MLLVGLVTALLGWALLLPEDLKKLGNSFLDQPLLCVNVYFWQSIQAGYFGESPACVSGVRDGGGG
jgi:hypothetical protein